MSAPAPERLIYMANQIARFFASQPEGAAGAAAHLKSFWDPSMRAEIGAWRAAGGEGLHPLAVEAIDLLRPETERGSP
jgi:formate dehydrogenase subunit delta